MMDTLIESSTNFLSKSIACDKDTYDKLKYGISIIYLNFYKTLILIALSLILGIFNYVFVFFVGYSILRLYASGIHLNNDKLCTIIGLTSIIGLVYLSIHISLNFYVYLLLFIFSLIAYYLYSPGETKKRPIAKKRVRSLKIKSLICVLIFFVVSYFVGDGVWRSLITYSVVLEAINILPLTYKLLEGR